MSIVGVVVIGPASIVESDVLVLELVVSPSLRVWVKGGGVRVFK